MKLGLVVTRVDADTTVAAARACERAELDSIWLVEDLWHRGVMPLATACALATERVRIGIGVVNPYNQHPSLIAMNYGVLAEIARGRAVLGVGSSVARWVEQMGIDHRLPRTSVKEAIEITRELLAGGPSSYSGKAFTLDRIELGFEVDQPAPLFMGAMGERSVRTCGEVADGWVVSVLEPVGYVRKAREWMGEGAERAGRDVGELEVVQYLPFACSHDSAEARATAKEIIGIFIVGELELYRNQGPVMSALSAHLDTVSEAEYMDVLDRLVAGLPASEAITDALCDELAIAGTPQECAEQLRRYGDAGVTEAVLLPAGEATEAAAELVAREIRPLIGD
jgi:5,10-methylenetetrahydromethanopterin reductase